MPLVGGLPVWVVLDGGASAFRRQARLGRRQTGAVLAIRERVAANARRRALELWADPVDRPSLGRTLLERTSERGYLWPALSARDNNSPGAPVTTSGSVADNTWHHVVLPAARDNTVLFLDGVKVGTTAGDIDHLSMDRAYLGGGYTGNWQGNWPGSNGGWSWVNGQLDEVAVYDYPLTGQTVADHYALRNGSSQLTKTVLPTGRNSAPGRLRPEHGAGHHGDGLRRQRLEDLRTDLHRGLVPLQRGGHRAAGTYHDILHVMSASYNSVDLLAMVLLVPNVTPTATSGPQPDQSGPDKAPSCLDRRPAGAVSDNGGKGGWIDYWDTEDVVDPGAAPGAAVTKRPTGAHACLAGAPKGSRGIHATGNITSWREAQSIAVAGGFPLAGNEQLPGVREACRRRHAGRPDR
ncbi:LamG domain-containing protein [Kitasatospora sp. A2-31]|uniref:LamG domain-containing protein n=1 Tax=Kitasatospora sp. A2-31 TaxID=2916414 RepID=UPI001EEC4DEE|nr:LamG domain-containing protein [Kitasatospora sp. A2-31]MCG6495217.1 LamG domain-containing protein [Kitasatospora sp. A2-31]